MEKTESEPTYTPLYKPGEDDKITGLATYPENMPKDLISSCEYFLSEEAFKQFKAWPDEQKIIQMIGIAYAYEAMEVYWSAGSLVNQQKGFLARAWSDRMGMLKPSVRATLKSRELFSIEFVLSLGEKEG